MKKNRHDKIIELINNHEVETQEQLASLLKEAGYDVTQATVSRDIRQMKLTKQVTPDGRQKYVYTTASIFFCHSMVDEAISKWWSYKCFQFFNIRNFNSHFFKCINCTFNNSLR